ncbi:MAG TPA: carboxypeptidase-like regulatory domain-containing protein [Gemmatimonadaceae bacterium]|nr:carboxypeptidase-like regulatory domain-containing protein [Gemmatimonadaceae bacterium]
MSSAYSSERARAIRSASLLPAFIVLFACAREKSTASDDTSAATATKANPAADSSGQLVKPESSPEAMRAFAAAHLRPGVKPGDFLTDRADYPTGDTADVYRAVLDSLYVSKDGFPGQVVLYDVASPRGVTCAKMPCPILPEGTRSEPKLATINAFRIATLNRRHITPKFKYHIPLKLMGEKEQRELEIDGRKIAMRDSAALDRLPREMPFWLGFQARYPHAWGYAALSAVGMNPQKNEAILQVMHRCGASCHSTETMILWKVRGQWQVIERVAEEGDSTVLANTSLRYRGVGLHTPQHEIQEFARRDSIRLGLQQRDIHGRVTTQDGKPLPGATIELHMKAQPNAVWRVASDFRGDYRFLGVLTGGAGLTVRCPKTSNRPDTLAAATATDVGSVRSVEVNVQIDRAVCGDDTPPTGERQVEPLTSTLPSVEGTLPVAQPQITQPMLDVPMQNEFDAARARASAYPSPEEAAVYAGVFDRLGSPGEGKVILLYGATRFSCKGASCNENYRRRIRYEPRVMLSAMENFLTVREQQHDFRADFPGRPDVRVVGDSAIAALERATSRVNAFSDASVIQQAWPDVAYSLSFSAVGFSAQHRQAIVEVMRSGSEPLLCILNRTATGWQVVRWIKP